MTILTELAALYERRAERAGWPRPGYSTESVGAEVVLREDGTVERIRPLMAPDEKGKMQRKRMQVPAAPADRRGLKIVPGLFWDPAPYAIGVSVRDGEISIDADRAEEKHAAFRSRHLALLTGATSTPLVAFRRFLEIWRPEHFASNGYPPEAIDQNIVFMVGEGKRPA